MTTALTDMRLSLEEALGIAEAADACARIGQTSRSVDIANGADDLIMSAERLLNDAAKHVRTAPDGAEPDQQADSDIQAYAPSAPAAELPAEESVAAAADESIRPLLHQACTCLQRAVGIARAAELRATTSGLSVGLRLALDIEPLLYDVKQFINTASILNRLSRQSGAPG